MLTSSGKGETKEGKSEVNLYIDEEELEELEDFSIQITPIDSANIFYTSEFNKKNGTFTVYGEGKFYWFIYGEYKKDEFTIYPDGGF
jgi:hypothetical protein